MMWVALKITLVTTLMQRNVGMYHRHAAIWTSVERILDRDRTNDNGDGTDEQNDVRQKQVLRNAGVAWTYIRDQVMA